MKNDSLKNNKFSYPTTGTVTEEKAYMFTESKLDHIESLAKRAKNNEKPHWDVFEILISSGATMALFSLGILVPSCFDTGIKISQTWYIILGIMLGVGGICSVSFLIAKFRNNSQYNSLISEIISVINKTKKKSNESQNSSRRKKV